MDKQYFIDKLEDMRDEKDMDLEKSREHWDNRASEFYEYTKDSGKNETIEFLSGFMDLKDKTVLDVGFGAGRYLKLLADEGAKLSGVELSGQMMEYAKKHCRENDIDVEKMELLNLAWEDVDLDELSWRAGFDLVFAAMSPVLSSYRSIEKLIAASKHGVFFSTHVLIEEDIMSRVYKDIKGEDYKEVKNRFIYLLNILYLDGYFPNVKIVSGKRELEFTVDELTDRYSRRIFSGRESKEERARMKSIIREYEADGKVIVNMNKKDALIYFEV